MKMHIIFIALICMSSSLNGCAHANNPKKIESMVQRRFLWFIKMKVDLYIMPRYGNGDVNSN